MFFKKFLSLFLVLSLLSSYSGPIYAADLSREYMPLPRVITGSNFSSSYLSSNTNIPIDQSPQIRSAVDLELDRMEAIQQALNEAAEVKLAPAVVVSPNKPVILKKEVPVAIVKSGKDEAVIKTIFLQDIVNSSSTKPGIRITYHSSVIIEGKNIQRFLVMDEGFIKVEKLDRNQVKVDALKYGGTFLNVWDDDGRHTIYVGIVFPEAHDTRPVVESQAQEHERPFRFTYSSDWGTYYFGAKGEDFKRKSYDLLQNFALEGPTPFGSFDTSMTQDNNNGISNITSYTVGLSQIPIEGTSDFNIRGFDANKTLSPLTMSSTSLRGVFTDINLLHDTVGLSYYYGQKRPYFAFINQTTPVVLDSYVNAFKFTLFPKDRNNQVSINAAEGFGSQHEDNLTKKVYSIEAKKKIFNTYLNGEYAQSDKYHASLAGLKWEKGNFNSALNFRQINKNFTTVSAVPSNQGEIGTVWTTNYDTESVTEQTTLDVYRQYLFYNPQNPNALNLDGSGRLRIPLWRDFFSDTNIYYVHTPGEVSPRRNLGLDERISKIFNMLGFKNTYSYVGGALQRVRYEFSTTSAYDRFSIVSGLQVPLTTRLSVYENYDYSWVNEIDTENRFNPSVFNTGFYYHQEFTDRFSGNFDASYHREMGAKGTTSYLAGEDSAGVSLGFSYNPMNDVNLFLDGRLRKVWPQIESSLPYNDLDVRLGLRMSFDVLKRGWDPSGSVSGHVYKDKNGDGHYGLTDQGIKGVHVKAGDYQVVTDETGYYRLKVKAKSVLVAPDTATIPSGTIFSTPTSQTVNIKQWQNLKADFGLNSQTGVYGLVFVDKNENSMPDSTDQFIKSVKIILDKKETALTDSQGAFYFRNITEGEHVLAVDINSLPINMIPKVKLKNDIKVAEGTTYIFHIPLKINPEKTDS